MAVQDILLKSARLLVNVSPEFGGSITSIRSQATGSEVLWNPHWASQPVRQAVDHPLGVDQWVRHSRGGWQILIPNAGDACSWLGVDHGFHGESSVAEWAARPGSDDNTVILALALSTMPLEITREIRVDGDVVFMTETIVNRSAQTHSFMWVHHPGLGGAILDGPTVLDSNARRVDIDSRVEPIGIPVPSGASGVWPVVAGHDLTRPVDGTNLLSYLSDFDGPPWVTLMRVDRSIGVRIGWDGGVHPHCWLWEELGGSSAEPWNGQERVIGIEPSSSRPSHGLATVQSTTGETVTLSPHATTTCTVTLTVMQ